MNIKNKVQKDWATQESLLTWGFIGLEVAKRRDCITLLAVHPAWDDGQLGSGFIKF
jgi:hypothetical protein